MTAVREAPLHLTTLKRDKKCYESTALSSLPSHPTPARPQTKYHSLPSNYAPAFKARGELPPGPKIPEQRPSNYKTMVELIAYEMAEQKAKMKREGGGRYLRHFYHRGFSRSTQSPLMSVPRPVREIYQQKQLSRSGPSSPPIAYSYGYLPVIDCLYYSIEDTLVFVRGQDLPAAGENLEDVPVVVHEVRGQVVTIVETKAYQGVVFAGCDVVLVVAHPWELEFYGWQLGNVFKRAQGDSFRQVKEMGLKRLNYIYKLPVERVPHLTCSHDGRLLFFDEMGALHQVAPVEETKFLLCKTGKYRISNYVNASRNTLQVLSTKQGTLATIRNLASNVAQISKYFFPSKIETLQVICDERRQLLFAVLNKKITLLFGHEDRTFVVCYSLGSKPRLLHTFSQQFFMETCRHQISLQAHPDLRIHSIQPCPSYYQNGNLAVMTKSNIQVVLQVVPGQAKLIEIIKPPDNRMFDMDLHEAGLEKQYSPKVSSDYFVRSWVVDGAISINTVQRDRGVILSFITVDGGQSLSSDVNLLCCALDLDIQKMSTASVKLSKMFPNISSVPGCYRPILPTDEPHSLLTGQALLPPQRYLLQTESHTQTLTLLRPIDLLYTALHVLTLPGAYLPSPVSQAVLKVFSGVRECVVGVEEVCTMLLQMLCDGETTLLYAVQVAKELVGVWAKGGLQETNTQKTVSRQVSTLWASQLRQPQTRARSNSLSSLRLGHDHSCKCQQLSPAVAAICRQLLTELCQRGPSTKPSHSQFFQFPQQPLTAQPAPKHRAIQFKISIIVKYLSRVVVPVWDSPVNGIDQNCLLLVQAKVQSIRKYVSSVESELKIISLEPETSWAQQVNHQAQQLMACLTRILQLLELLQHVPLLPGCSFGEALRAQHVLIQPYLFRSLHREYKHTVVEQWRLMFSTYIRAEFVKIVRLYGEVQTMTSTIQIVAKLSGQEFVGELPQYFVEYLVGVRKLTIEQIQQINKSNGKKTSFKDGGQSDDLQFQIPELIVELSRKYMKSSVEELSASDLSTIASLLDNEDQSELRLTISNKKTLVTYLRNKLPKDPALVEIYKCIDITYELYRYYLEALRNCGEGTTGGILRHFTRNKAESRAQNCQTLALLNYGKVIDPTRLRKLVWLTSDYWLMTDYCAVFGDTPALLQLMQDICMDHTLTKKSDYDSFEAYIHRFLLNIAIKSEYSLQLLPDLCVIMDEHTSRQPYSQELLRNFLDFSSLKQLDSGILWLPKHLVKIGYPPAAVYSVEVGQLEQKFDKALMFADQTIYCVKLLNCYYLADKFVREHRNSFVKIVSMHLDALERNKNIKEKIVVGMRKMLDEMASWAS